MICSRPTLPKMSQRSGTQRCGNPNARVRHDVPGTKDLVVVLCDDCARELRTRTLIARMMRKRAARLAAIITGVLALFALASCAEQINGLADPASDDADAPSAETARDVDAGSDSTIDDTTRIDSTIDDGHDDTNEARADVGTCLPKAAACTAAAECCTTHCEYACIEGDGCRYACVP